MHGKPAPFINLEPVMRMIPTMAVSITLCALALSLAACGNSCSPSGFIATMPTEKVLLS